MDRVSMRKIVREITANRSRTALTVLSVAVGLFAVSLTFRTQAILSRNVLNLYSTTIPAAIVVQVRPADAELATTIRRVPGVLSWIPATLLALPLSRLLSDVLGWSIVSCRSSMCFRQSPRCSGSSSSCFFQPAPATYPHATRLALMCAMLWSISRMIEQRGTCQ